MDIRKRLIKIPTDTAFKFQECVHMDLTGQLPLGVQSFGGKWWQAGKEYSTYEDIKAKMLKTMEGRPKKYKGMSYYLNKKDENKVDYEECEDVFIPAGICPDEQEMARLVHQRNIQKVGDQPFEERIQ